MVEILLKAGAELDIKDAEGYTPLGVCVDHGDLKTLEVLLQYSDKTVVNKASAHWAKTPLGIAFMKKDLAMIELLLQHGANPYEMDPEGDETIQSIPPDIDPDIRDRITELIRIYR